MVEGFKYRYTEGEVIAVQDFDVTDTQFVGVFRVLRNFDVQKVLDKYHEKWPEATTATKFVEFLLSHHVLEVVRCTEVSLDLTTHQLIHTKPVQ